jgi:hypothetical protein
MQISDLTDKQFKSLRDRLNKLGREKLIDRLENEQINANLANKPKKAERCAVSIEWVKKQSGWIV